MILLVLNIYIEKFDKKIPLFVCVFNIPRCCSFPEELHEAALHHDPEHPGKVEQDGQEQEVERNPLVVGVVHYGGGVHVLVKIKSATSQSPKTQFTWSPPEQAPLYSLKTKIILDSAR